MNSPERFRAPPALVARLMGLSDIPPLTTSELAVAEKRRRLLGALEKCDEDLKALKKIIDVVKSSVAGTGNDADDEGRPEKGHDLPLLPQQPSPVSVLDEFTPSAFSGFSKRYTINGKILFSTLIKILLLAIFAFSFDHYIIHKQTHKYMHENTIYIIKKYIFFPFFLYDSFLIFLTCNHQVLHPFPVFFFYVHVCFLCLS